MRKRRGFADNGACPVDPTGDKTPLITKSALLLLEVEGRMVFVYRAIK